MSARMILSRAFERDAGGFDHRDILCKIVDGKYGPLAFAIFPVVIWNGFDKVSVAYKVHDEVEMTEGEISDAQKILDRITK